jgi:hypothetical protein
MKYIVTESQLAKTIFWYLDNQDFILIKNNESIYFANSEGDEFAQIRYDMEDGWCMINYELINELSSFFSLDDSDSQDFIALWLENNIQVEVSEIFEENTIGETPLRIPYN